ncbi:helix-turn-helix domain-containing protein [Polaribacter sp. PL03]|uniref:helix-turn-helix domain-containing protein n=1 Tax=Polaribacter sp. PL03 TaxID=3088353 RepID=UPI0029CEFE0C|nr:helix-turn-helix domain-containing protein [Polaribacter sp. PL03]MDX6746249.1 helix-turn-helix domain-containing protein [Polaribacter sp. PL03]
MKQPELGKRIYQLRKGKGLTQEELVEQCNINVRTIQRIEAGEVNPRSYTVKLILEVLGEDLHIIEEYPTKEDITISWTKKELQILNYSWVFGLFYSILTLVGVLMEIYFATSNVSNLGVLAFRIPFAIAFFILIIPFLRGYKVIAEKFNNTLLMNAVYIYFGVGVIMTIIMFFTSTSGLISPLEIGLTVISMVIFGIGELIMGLGILKLKENVSSLAKVTGFLKIINGILLVTVILSPIALFFMIAVLILEIILLHNMSTKFNASIIHDGKVHS